MDLRSDFVDLISKGRIPVQSVRGFVMNLAWASRFENQSAMIDSDFDMAIFLLKRIEQQLENEFFSDLFFKIQAARWLVKTKRDKDIGIGLLNAVCKHRWTHRKMLKSNDSNA